MVCEKCWRDAFLHSRTTGRSQTECYMELLEERKDNPCEQDTNEKLHMSDCAIHNEPAYPNGVCDCKSKS